MTAARLSKELRKYADSNKAKILQKFFKTGPGEYAEEDIFIGAQVPLIRKIAARYYRGLALEQILKLIKSPVHEERLLSLAILVLKYREAGERERKNIYHAYLANTKYINNWDLVDLSAEHIAGGYLAGKNKTPLYKLAESGSLWERRIAIIATFHFIKNKNARETFKICRMLLADKEDLIHKAAGWMLREAGKRVSTAAEERFLKKYYKTMPRTMLRYAIERFPEKKRQNYLKGKI
jgi:3-methyladenine DNA glycosylase AlkD